VPITDHEISGVVEEIGDGVEGDYLKKIGRLLKRSLDAENATLVSGKKKIDAGKV